MLGILGGASCIIYVKTEPGTAPPKVAVAQPAKTPTAAKKGAKPKLKRRISVGDFMRSMGSSQVHGRSRYFYEVQSGILKQ